VLALACALTAALYVPLVGLQPAWSFPGDLIVTVYLLSVVTMGLALAGANTADRFSLIGAVRTLTQLFSYEAPFMFALLGPAIVARSWQISAINSFAGQHWMALTQPIGFVVALIGLMGKLELPPFDAPEAETEIVKGALTEYSGRGLALFQMAKSVELVVGLTLIAAFYLGGIGNPLDFFVKTLVILLVLAGLQSLFARFRIEQTAKWWRYASLLLLAQWLILVVLGGSTL
jgi:NADH-quinone oxidoreductase subunit H